MVNYISKKVVGDFEIISKLIYTSLTKIGINDIIELNLQSELADVFGVQIGKFTVYEVNNVPFKLSHETLDEYCSSSLQNRIILQELGNNFNLVLTAKANKQILSFTDSFSKQNYRENQERIQMVITSLKENY